MENLKYKLLCLVLLPAVLVGCKSTKKVTTQTRMVKDSSGVYEMERISYRDEKIFDDTLRAELPLQIEPVAIESRGISLKITPRSDSATGKQTWHVEAVAKPVAQAETKTLTKETAQAEKREKTDTQVKTKEKKSGGMVAGRLALLIGIVAVLFLIKFLKPIINFFKTQKK